MFFNVIHEHNTHVATDFLRREEDAECHTFQEKQANYLFNWSERQASIQRTTIVSAFQGIAFLVRINW